MTSTNLSKQSIAIIIASCCIAAFFSTTTVRAQTLPCEAISREEAYNFQNLSLEQRTQAADVVVEGQVIDGGFILTAQNTYFSYAKIQVYKVFKGKNVKKTLVILGSEYRKETRNNRDTLITCYPNLDAFSVDPVSNFGKQYFLFFLKYSNKKIENKLVSNNDSFILIESENGHYHYMQKYWKIAARSQKQQDSLRTVKEIDLEKEMYRTIEKYTHKKYKVLKRKPKTKEIINDASSKLDSEQASPIITAIDPNPISSGKISTNEFTIQHHLPNNKTTPTPKC